MAKQFTSPVKFPTQEEYRQKKGIVFDEAGYEYYLYEFLGCDRRGDRVSIKYRRAKSSNVESQEFLYRDECLLDLEGLVMKRVTD